MASNLERIARGVMIGAAFVGSYLANPKYTSLEVPVAKAEMQTVNGYTFDYNPNGWPVPQMDEAKTRITEPGAVKIGERWEDLSDEIPGKETLKIGYRLPEGQVVTLYILKGQLFSINYNRFDGQEGFAIRNINPITQEREDKFYYKYIGSGTKMPFPLR
jgi:hypothetical protein